MEELKRHLFFLEGCELPDFAAFYLLRTDEGIKAVRKYFRNYASIAKNYDTGCILESPTWRASPDWGKKLGYSEIDLAESNRRAIDLLHEIRNEFENGKNQIVISGCVGPRGDGYVAADLMSAEQAEEYHSRQIETFGDTVADMVTAITINYAEAAIGIARSAKAVGMSAAIAFTVETDGNLPTGPTLKDAIESFDKATGNYPAYYMINCAHPTLRPKATKN